MKLHCILSRGLAATILALAAAHVAAEPADGVLDPTFADDGIAIVGFDTLPGNPIDIALDSVVDSFNRIYLVGTVMTSDGQRIGITRLRADGTLDTNYGPQDVGLVVAPEELGFSLSGVSAAIDLQGRLLIGGTVTKNGNDDFAVCRFGIDGSLDAFPNGLQCVSIAFDLETGNKSDILRDIAVQPDGKIVMVGSAVYNTSQTRLAIARLDTNGDPDVDFIGQGHTVYGLPEGIGKVRLNAIAIQENGKFVVVGDVVLAGFDDTDMVVARLMPNGAPDSTFNDGDFLAVLYPIQSTRDHSFTEVALLPGLPGLLLDQTIMAAGSIESAVGSGLYDGLLAKILPTAIPEAEFGTGGSGYRIDSRGNDLKFNDVKLESNGNILVVGTIVANSNPATTMDYYVTRFLPDGSTDQVGFNPPVGYSLVNLGGSSDIANALVLQKDRIVVVGASLVGTSPPNLDFSAIGLLRDRIFANGYD